MSGDATMTDTTATPVRIRTATPADARAARAVRDLLDQLGYPDEVDAVGHRLRELTAHRDAALLLADLDGRPVGLLALHVVPRIAEATPAARITALVVAEDQRTAGVGRALVLEAERVARSRGCAVIEVSSGRRRERDAAHAFYPALGYHDRADRSVVYLKPLTDDADLDPGRSRHATPPARVEVVHATADHLPHVADLYAPYVLETHHTFELDPPSLDDWRAWYDRDIAGGPHLLLVALEAGRVAGYARTGTFNERAAYATSCTTTVYVRRGNGGRGIGVALYRQLLDRLDASADFHRALAGIALPNPASIRLHERVGFRRAGLYREVGRKLGRWWDVAWYDRPLGG